MNSKQQKDRRIKTFLPVMLSLMLTGALHGQVFEVNGGTSTLYQSQGGTIVMHGPTYDAAFGAGVTAGQFNLGGNLTKVIGKSTYIAGQDVIQFQLPTDVFDSSHYLVAEGAGMTTRVANTKVFAFAGATSTQYSSPFYVGASADEPAGFLFLEHPLSSSITLSSKMVFLNQITAIQSLDWKVSGHTRVGLSAGVGADEPYAAASADSTSRNFDIKAAYIEAGSGFQKIPLGTPLSSEPDRENISVTLRPNKLVTLSGGRQNFLSPLPDSPVPARGTVNEVAGTLEVAGVATSIAAYGSSFLGQSNVSEAYSMGRALGQRLHVTSSYLESQSSDGRTTRSFVSTFSEQLTPRWNVVEMVTRSGGQTTSSFGGGFLSNRAQISAEYETYYTPERTSQPFEQALIVDALIHLAGSVNLHGATFVEPTGALGYTADLRGVFIGPHAMDATQSANAEFHNSIAQCVLTGRVIDNHGQPVEGAAILIDQMLVYTDDEGRFLVRERKPHVHQIKVSVEQFLTATAYQLVSAPPAARSSADDRQPAITIVVQPKPAAASSGSA